MNRIHPTAVIGDRVDLGDDNVVGAYAVLSGNVRVGSGNWIGSHVAIGGPPEVRSVAHGSDWLDDAGEGVRIGDGNVIREAAQIHSGWKAATFVGDGTFIMNQVYVGHDGNIADGVTLASGVRLGGHVVLGEAANLGLGTVVHQSRVVGALAMVGMGSVVTRDIPPFSKAFGSPCRIRGVNVVGLRRAGITPAAVAWAEAAMPTLAAPHELPADIPGDLRDHLIRFVEALA